MNDIDSRIAKPGVAIGLAWTPAGGDMLFIEATAMQGKKGLTLTGQLGDVMKESALAALSFIRTNASKLGVVKTFTKTWIFISMCRQAQFPKTALPPA